MSLLHIGGSAGTSVVPAEGVDFYGVNDYLSRSTDLVGNVDSKTFTFSAWVYTTNTSGARFYTVKDLSNNISFEIQSVGTGVYIVNVKNTSGVQILSINFLNSFSLFTHTHIMVSIDLSNTLNRHIYINDLAATASWVTYTNDIINFTNSVHEIGKNIKGRLSHVFLSYDYIDLSIEANRRIFISSDGKPT